jgi:hypothetical protein
VAYLPNIPQGSQRPSQMYDQITTNFTELNAQYGVNGDHVEFASATNQGKHKQSTYIQQASDPSTAGGEGSVYVKDAGAGREELYYRRESSGPVIQLSVIKAWAFVGALGGVVDGYNVASAIRTAQGQYTITFTNAMPNGNYGVQVSTIMNSTFTAGGLVGYEALAPGSFKAISAAFGVDQSFCVTVLRT